MYVFLSGNKVFIDENKIISNGFTMKYIIGENGNAIINYSSKFLIEELEKTHNGITILSKNNVVIDDLNC